MIETKSVQVEYYALLREQRGQSSEAWSTSVSTLNELYSELKEKYQLSLPASILRVAANNKFASWDDQLNDGDLIVFIPPVAGG